MTIREATAEEILAVAPRGYESWGAVLEEEDGRPVGRIFLSRAVDGAVFGHNTECHSVDKTGALRLWSRARKKARDWGVDSVWIHFTDDFTMLPFWERLGFKQEMTMYRGRI
jgi:GNAT superfamily N-acetyltransferase